MPSETRPPARSTCATQAVTVDLPLVPVTATVRPAKQRDAHSSSPSTGTPAARSGSSRGWSSGTPGLSATPVIGARSAASQAPSVCTSSKPARARSARPSAVQAASTFARGESSTPMVRAPPRRSSAPTAQPLRPRPTTRNTPVTLASYCSFSVLMLSSTKRMPTIQNRTTTCVSVQPLSSKWWCRGDMRKIRLPLVHLK